jgi:hypothetical protein
MVKPGLSVAARRIGAGQLRDRRPPDPAAVETPPRARHRAQSRRHRLVQICGVSGEDGRGRDGHPHRPRPDRAATRDLLLHLPADRLSGRCPPRRGEGPQLSSLCPVRHLLPAADRRPDRPPRRDRAAIRRPAHLPPRSGQPHRRPRRPRPRAVQEGGARGRHRGLRHSGVRRRRRGCPTHPARGLGWGARLRLPALLRFLGLLRHGDRPRPDDERAPADQLRQPLQGGQHRRLLAPLAHHAVALPVALPLRPARRQPTATARFAATATS